MRTYETTFIINPQTDDASIDKHVQDVANLITENDGKIIHQENMGTRRLAYEINKLTQGFYANFVYEAPQSFLPKLDRLFKLNEAYIRDLTVRFEGDPEVIFNKKDAESENARGDSRPSKTNAPVKADAKTEAKADAKTDAKTDAKADAPAKEEAKAETADVESVKEETAAETTEPEKIAPVDENNSIAPEKDSSDDNEL